MREGDGVYRIRQPRIRQAAGPDHDRHRQRHLAAPVGGCGRHLSDVDRSATPEELYACALPGPAGKCVDTVGMGAAVGTVLQIWQEVSGADDQLWTIAEVKERAKRAAKKAEAPAVEASAEAAPAAEKAPAKKTAARKPRTTQKAAAAKAEAAEEGKAETAAPAEKPAKPARKTAAKKTAAKAAEKAEPAKAEAPAEEKPAAEKPKRKCAPRKKKETV